MIKNVGMAGNENIILWIEKKSEKFLRQNHGENEKLNVLLSKYWYKTLLQICQNMRNGF